MPTAAPTAGGATSANDGRRIATVATAAPAGPSTCQPRNVAVVNARESLRVRAGPRVQPTLSWWAPQMNTASTAGSVPAFVQR